MVAALALSGCKSVDAQLTIPAPPEKIWSVLMDGASYGEWNPVLVEVEGEFQEGARLTYQMMTESGEPAEVEARVVKLDPGRELNQAGGYWGILTFDHHWILEPVEGGTRVTQHEDYTGIGVLFFDPSWFEAAYGRGNRNLRDRVVGDSGPESGEASP
ncbi:MAG: SRPBCC domain-containing protein [Myxococcota bacterium]|nr:SRPBCC domain-containing protein [Myxococcota bacterium]